MLPRKQEKNRKHRKIYSNSGYICSFQSNSRFFHNKKKEISPYSLQQYVILKKEKGPKKEPCFTK